MVQCRASRDSIRDTWGQYSFFLVFRAFRALSIYMVESRIPILGVYNVV